MLALDELADLVPDRVHHFEQCLIGSLAFAREEFHHSGNFSMQLDRKSKSRNQFSFRGQRTAGKVGFLRDVAHPVRDARGPDASGKSHAALKGPAAAALDKLFGI